MFRLPLNLRFSKSLLKLNGNLQLKGFARFNVSKSPLASLNTENSSSTINIKSNYSEEVESLQSNKLNKTRLDYETEEQINQNQGQGFSNENTKSKKSQTSKVDDKFEAEKTKE
jgi:hypothetical protein